jgi:hypothetical protein
VLAERHRIGAYRHLHQLGLEVGSHVTVEVAERIRCQGHVLPGDLPISERRSDAGMRVELTGGALRPASLGGGPVQLVHKVIGRTSVRPPRREILAVKVSVTASIHRGPTCAPVDHPDHHGLAGLEATNHHLDPGELVGALAVLQPIRAEPKQPVHVFLKPVEDVRMSATSVLGRGYRCRGDCR